MRGINSKEYWDHRFATNWVEFNGINQTRAFMQLLLSSLPDEIDLNGLSILDWGCALGQGVEVLSDYYNDSEVCGLDISEVAIQKCLELYPLNDFYCGDLVNLNERFDVIISSNCLEHFDDPIQILEQIMNYADKYVIVMVPYKEENVGGDSEHRFSFDEHSFPEELLNFKCLHKIILEDCSGCWAGQQILVIYEKESQD